MTSFSQQSKTVITFFSEGRKSVSFIVRQLQNLMIKSLNLPLFTETSQTQATHNPETRKAFAEVVVRKSKVTLDSKVTPFHGNKSELIYWKIIILSLWFSHCSLDHVKIISFSLAILRLLFSIGVVVLQGIVAI